MQCPQCQQNIREDASLCPACGYDVAMYWSFIAMKNDLTRLKKDAFDVYTQVDWMHQHFSQFDQLFAGTATRSPVDAERPRQEPIKASKTPPLKSPIILGQPRREKIAPPPLPKEPLKPRREPGQSEVAFGQLWLLVAGVITTVLAVGWFLKYSFDQNWVGPAGRVALAYLGGVAFLVGGESFRRKAFQMFGLYLIGGGIAMLYFSTFAAFQIYTLLPQSVAFGLMIIVTALAGMLALIYDVLGLAVLGLIGGFLTPMILSAGHENQIALMTYMTILNAGILSIAFFKQWRLLNYLGFFFTWLLFSGWFFAYYGIAKFWETLIFLNIFFVIYAFAPFAYHVLKGHGKQLSGIRILAPNAFIGLGYSFAMIREYYAVEAVSIATLCYAAIFLWMAQFIYQRNREQIDVFVMLLAQAMLFLIITIPLLFSQHWITVFWAIQAAVLLWAAVKLNNSWLYSSFTVLIALTLMKFFGYDYSVVFDVMFPDLYVDGGYWHRFGERLITSAVALAALWISAVLFSKAKALSRFAAPMLPAMWGIFTVALFAMLNIEVSAFFYDYGSQARFAAISVLWTAFSLVMIMFGFVYNISLLRKCAIGLFAATMLKVFLLDMANVSTPYRVVSFLVLGLMLIGASYLYHRFKERILPPDAEE